MESVYRILKKPFFGKFMGQWRNPLNIQERRAWKRFELTNRSGATLRGLYFRSPFARANIVLGHPMGREAKGFFLKRGYADFLIDNGYNVFVFDFNGFGESETGNFDYPGDVLAVGAWVKEKMPQLQIGYLGVSMGASWGICALSQPGHVFHAAVFDSPFTTVDEFWRKNRFAYFALKILGSFMYCRKKKLNTLQCVKRLKHLKSARFICSVEDEVTPMEMAMRLRDNCNVRNELYVANTRRHGGAYRANMGAYEGFVIEYFNRELGELARSN